MKTTYHKLSKKDITALIKLSERDDTPFVLTEESAMIYCTAKDPVPEGVQTYGVFADSRLISVMTATFCRVFPHKDSPKGRIVHISGAFTLPEYRHRHYASDLLKMIEEDAAGFDADYICCDSTADGLYLSFGFEPAPENETRLWKSIPLHKEDLL